MPESDFKNLLNKDPFIITHFLSGTAASLSANYGVVFNAQFNCEVMAVAASWETASTSGTLQLEKLTGTTAPGSGNGLLTSTISTAGVANTVNHGVFFVSSTARQLVRGDRLAISDGGTLTSLVSLATTIVMKPLGKGHYNFVLGTAGNT